MDGEDLNHRIEALAERATALARAGRTVQAVDLLRRALELTRTVPSRSARQQAEGALRWHQVRCFSWKRWNAVAAFLCFDNNHNRNSMAIVVVVVFVAIGFALDNWVTAGLYVVGADL